MKNKMSPEESTQKELKEMESLESQELSARVEEVKKTPEEIRHENINRLTKKAKEFIAEKKAQRQEGEIRKKLEETKEIKDPEEEEEKEVMPESIEEIPVEEKEGFFGGLKDKYRLWKLQRAGLSDPEKALEFFNYINSKQGDNPYKLSRYVIEEIRDTFALTNEPIAFYKKIKQIKKRDDTGFMSYRLKKLMGEPDILAKLDLYQLTNELLGYDTGGYLDELKLKSFFQKTELNSRLSSENVEKIKELRNVFGLYFKPDDLDWLINLVEDDKVYGYVGQFSNTSYKNEINTPYALRSLAYKLELLEAEGLVEDVLAGAKMNLDIERTLGDLTSSYDEDREKSSENIKKLKLEEMFQDEKFRVFTDDFSSLAEKDFSIEEYDRLEKLYIYYGDFALAFVQAFSELGIIQKTNVGALDIGQFEDIIGHWANRSKATAPEAFFAVLEPKFKEFFLLIKDAKEDMELEKVLDLTFKFKENPEVITALETDDGRELFQFLAQIGIDQFASSNKELFSYPNLVTTLKKCDKVFDISGTGHIVREIINLHKNPELRDEMIDFLQKNDFRQGKKFEVDENHIKYLIKLMGVCKNHPDTFDLEAFKKDFDFFYGYQMLDIIENYPDRAKEIFNLSHRNLLDNKNLRYFFWVKIGNGENIEEYFENIEDILLSIDGLSEREFLLLSEIPREKRKDYFDCLKKLKELNLPTYLNHHIFNNILKQENVMSIQNYWRRVDSVIETIVKPGMQESLLIEQVDIILSKPDGIREEFVDILDQLNKAPIKDNSRIIIRKKLFEAEDFRVLWQETNNFLMLLKEAKIGEESYLIETFLDEGVKNREKIIERAKNNIEKNSQTQQLALQFSSLIEGNKSSKELSQEQLAYIRSFIEKHKVGDKGETIVNLAATLEIKKLLESGENFSWEKMIEGVQQELIKYQEIIEKNAFNNIPPKLRATIGMEYEVTRTIKDNYERNNFVGYKNNIQVLSRYAKIGQGADAVHEIATQATDNPYLMLLEMKLLQDLEYVDFNFRPKEDGGYYGAATGYHLSLGGESGVKVDSNSFFLNNMMMMNNWTGVNFEQEVSSVKVIRDRGYDSNNVLLLDNMASSIETKCFSIDRWEPFERTILTCYNSAIAIQAIERYTKIKSYDQILLLSRDFPASAEKLYERLMNLEMIKEPIDNPVVREIIFFWLKLQVDVLKAVEDHNENFLTNETDGYLDENGVWIDSQEVSGRNNQRYFQESLANYNKNRSPNSQYSTTEDFFKGRLIIDSEKIFNHPDPQNINAITCIGNLFLTKFSGFDPWKNNAKKKADPNVLAFLTNTREEGVKNERRKPDDVEKSVFDRNGELPQDYYYLQGGSEKLIIHQTQKLFIEFNKKIADLLKLENGSEEKGDLVEAA